MTAPGPQKMWGGRFDRGPDASFYEFERSWSFDRRLLPQEIGAGSRLGAGYYRCWNSDAERMCHDYRRPR